MSHIEIEAAAKDLHGLVNRARSGEEVVLIEDGREVAKLVPVAQDAAGDLPPRRLGIARGEWKIPEDFDAPLPDALFEPAGRPLQLGVLAGKATVPPDFDAPLPDDLLDLFEGR
jgi:antitoxin (DNA-binding transcriptional repressor) of toxin-antitoxin stability system